MKKSLTYKHKKSVLVVFAAAMLLFPHLTLAAPGALEAEKYVGPGQVDFGNSNVQRQTDAFVGTRGAKFGRVQTVPEMVGVAIRSLLVLLGTIFLIYMIYGGYLIMTSAGVDERIDKGKRILKSAIVGVILILGAYSITLLLTWFFRTSGSDAYDKCPIKPGETVNADPSLAGIDVYYPDCEPIIR